MFIQSGNHWNLFTNPRLFRETKIYENTISYLYFQFQPSLHLLVPFYFCTTFISVRACFSHFLIYQLLLTYTNKDMSPKKDIVRIRLITLMFKVYFLHTKRNKQKTRTKICPQNYKWPMNRWTNQTNVIALFWKVNKMCGCHSSWPHSKS